jgi:sugar O-acyltransferase (sialic acid O-acetyltransferase NeuD family)
MVIAGSKGFAKELLEDIFQIDEEIFLYDDISKNLKDYLYGTYPIITNPKFIKNIFIKNNNYFLGLGGVKNRFIVYNKLNSLGGKVISSISKHSKIGSFDVKIHEGVNIMAGVIITNSVEIGKCCLINLNTTIGHDVKIGEFCELSPGVRLSGNCEIGDFCTLGTNAVVLPKVKVGNNVVIGAGSVVTKDVPDNVLVVGVPAVIKIQNL